MTKDKSDSRVGLWIFFCVSLFFLFMIVLIAKPFIVALIAGGMMALVLNPWFRFLLRRMKRHLAINDEIWKKRNHAWLV